MIISKNHSCQIIRLEWLDNCALRSHVFVLSILFMFFILLLFKDFGQTSDRLWTGVLSFPKENCIPTNHSMLSIDSSTFLTLKRAFMKADRSKRASRAHRGIRKLFETFGYNSKCLKGLFGIHCNSL